MTTGPPLYLVSACNNAEEFVAAFRRYADRTGLFIPSSAPLPAGRRGTLALTLKDGGVMIEGQAEILQSSTKPTVLHGRPGMTVKFLELDETSKTVLGELEAARLSMRPLPLSVAPRPAGVPASPRPVVPPIAGRIDATNALAECIVIGDPSTLVVSSNAPRSAFGDNKFNVPSIPATRPGTPSSPPPLKPVPKMTSVGLPIVDKAPAKTESGRVVSNATTLGMPAMGRKPGEHVDKSGLEEATAQASGVVPPSSAPRWDKVARAGSADEETTARGHDAPKSAPAAKPLIQPVGADEATAIGAVPNPPPLDTSNAPRAENPRAEAAKQQRATSLGFPAMRAAFATQPLGVAPPVMPGGKSELAEPVLPKPGRTSSSPATRVKPPTTPPLGPRHPTPVAPVPIVRSPAKGVTVATDEEATDIATALPIVAPAEPTPAPGIPPAPEPAPTRSGGMRASEILAAIPAGDWTMSPDESTPHLLAPDVKAPPVAPDPEPTPTPAPAPAPTPTPSGDLTIKLDPALGWTEPAKPGEAPKAGNPTMAVASAKPINVVQHEEKATGAGESKIEVDSTLMDLEDSAALEDEAAQIVNAKPRDVAPPPVAPVHVPFPPRLPPTTGTATPAARFMPTEIVNPLEVDVGAPPAKSKKWLVVLAGIVALAVAGGVVAMMTLAKKPETAPPPTGRADRVTAPVAPDDAAGEQAPADSALQQAVVEHPGSSAPPPPEPSRPAPQPKTCSLEIKSIPTGAEIYLDKQNVGTAPGSFTFPCGVEAKLSLRKKSFPPMQRTVTPSQPSGKLVIKLAKATYSVKVTSTPAGATIKSGNKSLGVTPTTLKLPGFESTTLTLTKPGYATSTQRVNPKQNNISKHVTLKKAR